MSKKLVGMLAMIAAASLVAVGVQAQSSNADLSDLELSAGSLSPAFSSAELSYTASVTVSSITVTPTADDAGATITVNGEPVDSGDPSGAVSLHLGVNVIAVVVTA